jgi:hypothetical protein
MREQRQANEGRCRICNNTFLLSELTEEHCPPHACMEFLKLVQNSIVNVHNPTRRPQFKQNGIAFQKATCKKCNNVTLGTLYDPALLEFCRKVKNLTDTKIVLPHSNVSIEVQPVAIMKSALGHLMAASKVPTDTWLDTLARSCVTDENLPLPSELHIFYWFYPYPEYAGIHRDFGMPSVRSKITSPAEVFAVMKFFPVAFLVTKIEEYANLPNRDKWRSSPFSIRATIPIDLHTTFAPDWPDNADDGNFVMVGQPAEYSVIAKKR